MKKSDLYNTANHDEERILRTLRAAYAGQILKELSLLPGPASKDMVEDILEQVHARLPEISPEYDVSLLVTDCVRVFCGFSSSLPNSTPPRKSSRFDLSTVSGRLAARQYRIAKYAIPISCLLVLIGLLLLYFFPSL